MSYCRWSSMNWMCDMYVYENGSGYWTTHVAGNRRIFPPIPDIPLHWLPRFGRTFDMATRTSAYPSRLHEIAGRMTLHIWTFWHNRVHLLSMGLIPSRTIGLPHDSESFNDDTAGECADRLEYLRALGYKVPQYAIDALREEESEDSTA